MLLEERHERRVWRQILRVGQRRVAPEDLGDVGRMLPQQLPQPLARRLGKLLPDDDCRSGLPCLKLPELREGRGGGGKKADKEDQGGCVAVHTLDYGAPRKRLTVRRLSGPRLD